MGDYILTHMRPIYKEINVQQVKVHKMDLFINFKFHQRSGELNHQNCAMSLDSIHVQIMENHRHARRR